MKNLKKLNFIILIVTICVIVTFALNAQAEGKKTFGQKVKSFFKGLFNYPAEVTKSSVNIVGGAAKKTGDVTVQTAKDTGAVLTGNFKKTKDVVVKPLEGTAKVAVETTEKTVKMPAEAAKTAAKE